MTEVDVIPPRRNVTLSIDVDLWNRVRAEAERRCVSPRLLVRAALRELLDRIENVDPFPTSSEMIAEHEQPLVDEIARRAAVFGAGFGDIARAVEQLAHPPLTVTVPPTEPDPLEHDLSIDVTAMYEEERRLISARCSCGWRISATVPEGIPAPLIPANLRTELTEAHREHIAHLDE